MAHENLPRRRELVSQLAAAGLRFDGPLIANLAQAFGCSGSAIRIDLQHVIARVSAEQTRIKRMVTDA